MSELQLLWPVPENSIITRDFAGHVAEAKKHGWCYMPGNCPGGVYYYGGIDWGIATGTKLRMPMSGRAEVQNQGSVGYGMNLRITGKDGYYVILAHLQHVDYQTGQDVKAGEWGATSDDTGNSSGPHLHFELRHNGIPINPMPYLVGAIVEPPVVTPPSGFTLPVIPELPRYQTANLVTKWINLRDRPSSSGIDLGDIMPGTIVRVFGYALSGQDVWFAVKLDSGLIGYAAAYYGGSVWMEPVK